MHQAMLWFDMMKLVETCSRCTASTFLCTVVLWAVCFSMSPRGDSDSTLISVESQVKDRNKGVYSHAKLTWGGEERGKNGGMRGWIKQNLSLTEGAFKNSKTSFTLEDGLCVRVCTLVYIPIHLRVCMWVLPAHESNTISLQRAVFAMPAAPDTSMMSRWKIN